MKDLVFFPHKVRYSHMKVCVHVCVRARMCVFGGLGWRDGRMEIFSTFSHAAEDNILRTYVTCTQAHVLPNIAV